MQLDGDGEGAVLAQFARAIVACRRCGLRRRAHDAARGARTGPRRGARSGRARTRESFDAAALKELEARVTVLQPLVRKYGALWSRRSLARRVARASRELLEARDAAERHAGRRDRRLLERAGHALADGRVEGRRRPSALTRRGAPPSCPASPSRTRRCASSVDGDDGSEAQILFTPNPGQPEGPLQSLASGGELSRVLLALSLETGAR